MAIKHNNTECTNATAWKMIGSILSFKQIFHNIANGYYFRNLKYSMNFISLFWYSLTWKLFVAFEIYANRIKKFQFTKRENAKHIMRINYINDKIMIKWYMYKYICACFYHSYLSFVFMEEFKRRLGKK